MDGVMLVMESPVPEAIPLILSADALLTAKGGSTSHAAIAIHIAPLPQIPLGKLFQI
ncbi:MAG: hypothetical protein KKD59_07870 [Acidobacteria bacterium]|nr:hypothetical protein [Acidobacteriota bacterium]